MSMPSRSALNTTFNRMKAAMRQLQKGFGFAAIASVAAIGSVLYCFNDVPGWAFSSDLSDRPVLRSGFDPIAALSADGAWIQGKPTRETLRGKVILVNFWTYSCINSLRPLPYLRTWANRYKDRGLVVIGVHTPEFAFEKNEVNVKRAAAELGVNYPIMLDNHYETWRHFENEGWPGFFIIDTGGAVRYHRIGEGQYDKVEALIRQLLAKSDPAPLAPGLSNVAATGIEAEADWAHIRSPETYIGYDQAQNFASLRLISRGRPVQYDLPANLPLNHWGMGGIWTVDREYARLDAPGGTIAFRFHARDLHMVLGGRPDGRPVRFRVTIDGARPGASHGADTDADGMGTITNDRLYQLVRQSGAIRDRTFKIEFLDPGLRAYSFTFG